MFNTTFNLCCWTRRHPSKCETRLPMNPLKPKVVKIIFYNYSPYRKENTSPHHYTDAIQGKGNGRHNAAVLRTSIISVGFPSHRGETTLGIGEGEMHRAGQTPTHTWNGAEVKRGLADASIQPRRRQNVRTRGRSNRLKAMSRTNRSIGPETGLLKRFHRKRHHTRFETMKIHNTFRPEPFRIANKLLRRHYRLRAPGAKNVSRTKGFQGHKE